MLKDCPGLLHMHDLACAVQASVVTLSKVAVLLEMFQILACGPFG